MSTTSNLGNKNETTSNQTAMMANNVTNDSASVAQGGDSDEASEELDGSNVEKKNSTTNTTSTAA